MKSFHIAFAGVIIQLVFGILVILGAGEGLGLAGLVLAILGVAMIIGSSVGSLSFAVLGHADQVIHPEDYPPFNLVGLI